jgi:RNA polymerase sigma-70 factor, ECF subfamily
LDRLPADHHTRAWLYGITRKVLANHRRGQLRRVRLTGRLRIEHRLASTDDGDSAAVATAFARLTEDEREVLALAAWEGLDAGEIGTVLGCSRNAARIRLHRARRRLAGELSVGQEPLSVRRAEAR